MLLLLANPSKMLVECFVCQQLLEGIEVSRWGGFVVKTVNTSMAQPTDMHASIQLPLAVAVLKAFAPMCLFGNEMVEGQLNPAQAAFTLAWRSTHGREIGCFPDVSVQPRDATSACQVGGGKERDIDRRVEADQ